MPRTMKKNINRIFGLVLAGMVLLSTNLKAQQEFQFTQFMHNYLTYNPGYAGAIEVPVVQAMYRRQWIGFDNAPESKQLSFNSSLLGSRIGFGVTLANFTAGITNNYYGSMAYSYKLPITEQLALRVGLQGVMRYYGFDFADPDVVIRDPNDASVSQNTEQQFTGNFGMGFWLTYKNFYFGGAVPHFFPNELTLNNSSNIRLVAKESPHFYAMSGILLPINEKLKLRPAAMLKYVNNAPFSLDGNVSLIIQDMFTVGVSYRYGDDGLSESVDGLIMYQQKNIGIGLSYDYSLSDITEYNSGSIEALLRYRFLKEEENIANPRFFF